MNNQEPPTSEQANQLLSGAMETYSWTAFKPILYSPEKLRAWILEKLKPETDQFLDPDSEQAAEESMEAVEAEEKAIEFWQELDKKERMMIKEAFRAIWGKAGAAALPLA